MSDFDETLDKAEASGGRSSVPVKKTIRQALDRQGMGEGEHRRANWRNTMLTTVAIGEKDAGLIDRFNPLEISRC